jgi:transposase
MLVGREKTQPTRAEPMAGQLTPEAIVALHVLKEKGQSNRQIARTLQVTEASIRYHLRRHGQPDGRQHKPRKAESVADAIDFWLRDQQGPVVLDAPLTRPANLKCLFEWLQAEHDYQGSYKSVLRFVRAKYPKPRLRPSRRVETPPGAQAQVDWGEFSDVDVGCGPQKLYAFVMVLSHSRKEVLIWRPCMDQLSWHHAHNEAFRRLGGIPAVLRIDNLKTGVVNGAGPWGEINPAYRAYADAVRFHVDACLPRCPAHKGKVERKVKFVKGRLRLSRTFQDLGQLQEDTDRQLEASATRRPCPVTGLTVQATWQAEQRLLQALPILPEPFDLAVMRPVQRDCTINFEGRCYSVPFRLCGLRVEVRGCAGVVQVWHEGQVVAQHPRQTQGRLLLEPVHYEGKGDERVMPPLPLGQMGARLQEILEMPVEQRPLDLYAALAEVAR